MYGCGMPIHKHVQNFIKSKVQYDIYKLLCMNIAKFALYP